MGFLRRIRDLSSREATERQLRGGGEKDLEEEEGESAHALATEEHAETLLPWASRRQILRETAVGCAYLHSLSPPLLHRDLKSPNILIAGTL
jgi:serine/threonine protein kinase